MQLTVKILKTHNNALLPNYAKDGDSGADVYAIEFKDIPPNSIGIVDIGLSMELPQGWECQVRSRSGLACKGIVVANSPGTVDEGYRGPIKIILHNTTNKTYSVGIHDKIAQLVFCPVKQAIFVQSDELSSSDRGTGGLGSTGR